MIASVEQAISFGTYARRSPGSAAHFTAMSERSGRSLRSHANSDHGD